MSKTLAHSRAANKRYLPMSMVAPTAALVAMSLAFSVFAGPLMDFSRAAAQDMYERTPYLEAVFGPERTEGVRDELEQFAADFLIDYELDDDGAAEHAPVETSLQPDDEAADVVPEITDGDDR